MSVLVKDNNGWLICVKHYLDKIYNTCENENHAIESFKFRNEFFQIKTPYLMNSSASKISKNVFSERAKQRQVKKRKKDEKLKRETPDCKSKVEQIINERSVSIIQKARELYYLENPDISSSEWFENNSKAREAAKQFKNIDFNTPFTFYNEKSFPTLIKIEQEEYLLPAQTKFHLCDISSIDSLKGERFDLIVIDPPWENKSVRRNKKYSTLSCESLIDLPIEELCFPGCLIVIWTTNNQKQLDFLTKKLFIKWKVCDFTIWHWLKVTQKGHFIHPIDWHHKKPYENLLLVRIPFNDESSRRTMVLEPEPHKVIVSVPSSIHSHKPPLNEILKPYICEQPKCLELFARYLLPGWTSLGNEVLKLQNTRLFEKQSLNLHFDS